MFDIAALQTLPEEQGPESDLMVAERLICTEWGTCSYQVTESTVSSTHCN
ncbi:hypothetical protein [Dactylosporangium sp. NPDC051541]